jgi:hypothetical protein
MGTLLAFAIPLGIALKQIAWETLATRQAREAVAARFGDDARVSQVQVDFDARPIRVRAVVFTQGLRSGVEAEASRAMTEELGQPVEVAIEQVRIGEADAEAAQLAEARGEAADRSNRIVERLALVAGVPPERILIDREHRVARVRAVPLPGATMRAYQLLEARAGAGERDWTIMLVPPATALPEIAEVTDPPNAEMQAALGTAVWAYKRLETPIGVSGSGARDVVETLRAAGVEARAIAPSSGPTRLSWLPLGS